MKPKLFVLQLLPWLSMVGGGSWIGSQICNIVNPQLNIYIFIIFIGLQFGIFLLKDDPGWNVVVLVGLSIYFGFVSCGQSNFLFIDSRILVVFIFLGVSIISGIVLHIDLTILRFIISVIFLLVFFLEFFYETIIPDFGIDLLILSALITWSLVLSSIINRTSFSKYSLNPVSFACDLCLFLVNMFWMSEMITG